MLHDFKCLQMQLTTVWWAKLKWQPDMQLGCGVGNTSLPVAQANPDFQHIYSCDYSWTAVQLLQSNPQFQPDRMTAFVADVTSDNLSNTVPLAKVDVVTCIFVLSANKPDSLPNVRFQGPCVCIVLLCGTLDAVLRRTCASCGVTL